MHTACVKARYGYSAPTRKSRHVRYPRAVVQFTFQRARTEEKKRQRAAAIVEAARSPTTCTSSTRWISTGLSRSGGPAPLAKCCSRMRSSRRCRRWGARAH